MALEATREHRENAGDTLYRLALVSVCILMVGLGIAYGATRWVDAGLREKAMDAPTSTHIKTVGAQHYVIPAALMPNPAQHTEGFADRIDLSLALPVGPDARLSDVEITIQPRGRVRTSAALLDTVYVHQFGTDHVRGAPGLVGKPLEGDAGVSGEVVWYDPLSPAPFVAKCMAPVGGGVAARTCLRTLQLSDRNTAIVTFAPEVLESWRHFDGVVEAWLDTLRK